MVPELQTILLPPYFSTPLQMNQIRVGGGCSTLSLRAVAVNKLSRNTDFGGKTLWRGSFRFLRRAISFISRSNDASAPGTPRKMGTALAVATASKAKSAGWGAGWWGKAVDNAGTAEDGLV